jgi:hypothetical protein
LRNTSDQKGIARFYTSGDPDKLRSLLPALLAEEPGEIQKVYWLDDYSLA